MRRMVRAEGEEPAFSLACLGSPDKWLKFYPASRAGDSGSGSYCNPVWLQSSAALSAAQYWALVAVTRGSSSVIAWAR